MKTQGTPMGDRRRCKETLQKMLVRNAGWHHVETQSKAEECGQAQNQTAEDRPQRNNMELTDEDKGDNKSCTQTQ